MITIRAKITIFIAATLLGISSCGVPAANQKVSLKTPAAVVENDLAPHRVPLPVTKPTQKVKIGHTHAPVPKRTPRAARKRTQRVTPTLTSAGVWDRLALCESGGNWSINTGNGYYGGLQFSLPSWRAVGGSGLPSNASRSEQIRRGEILRSKQGWGAWPACSRKLGLR